MISQRGLRLKLEYDTSNPDTRGVVREVNSRFNLGLNYAFSKNLSFSSSFEGSQFRVGFSLKGNFLKIVFLNLRQKQSRNSIDSTKSS